MQNNIVIDSSNKTNLDELREQADKYRYPRPIWREGVLVQPQLAQDYKKAVELYTKAAEAGDSRSQYTLGEMYKEGEGVPKDLKKSFGWHLKAAEQGLSWAQSIVGEFYQYGLGIQEDRQKAFEWYQKALSQGNTTAMYHMGRWEQNAEKALAWYTKGADAGNDACRLVLADKYYNGEGVTQNYKKADEWRYLAKCRNKTYAHHSLFKKTLLVLGYSIGALPIISWGLVVYWFYRPNWLEKKQLHIDPLTSGLKGFVYLSAGIALWGTLGVGIGTLFKIGIEGGLILGGVVTGIIAQFFDTYEKVNYMALRPEELIKAMRQDR